MRRYKASLSSFFLRVRQSKCEDFSRACFAGTIVAMKIPNSGKANTLRSLLFLMVLGNLVACAAPQEGTPVVAASPTPRIVVVVATNLPATATRFPSRTAQPTGTLAPTLTPEPSATLSPTNTALPPTSTRVPRTATAIPATKTATILPPTDVPTLAPTHVFPTQAPTLAPSSAPTEQVSAAPPASFVPTELIVIPEGVLRMGGKGPEDDADEKPFHEVPMYEYRIEKYEVTNAQYQACVAAGACPAPAKNSSYTRASYFGNPEFAGYPVVNVTWNDANAYCTWLGRRLPNEAEWERAAKGVENWRFTWSNSIGMHFEWNAIFHGSPISFCEASCPLPNYWGDVNDGFPDTAPVGRFAEYDSSSGFGVIDMAGNVAEWTNNWYYGNAYAEGMDIYGPNDPTGVKTVRGGSWADEPRRNSDREPQAPDYSSDRIGFRCAQ